MHGFILNASGHLRPGSTCLVLAPDGALIAHGVAQCTREEALAMQKASRCASGVACSPLLESRKGSG